MSRITRVHHVRGDRADKVREIADDLENGRIVQGVVVVYKANGHIDYLTIGPNQNTTSLVGALERVKDHMCMEARSI